jgi:pyruvate, orthophosphate dikinase
MPHRWVYFFGTGKAEGGREMKSLLGGKGANLAEMTRIGVPVPPGFTITTEACRHYLAEHAYPDGLQREIETHLRSTEEATGKGFGSAESPLLVSVRSGAAVSMPGMMDTILNLGLNDRTVEALAREAGDDRFAFDSYRRFVQMYANVVLGVRAEMFETILEQAKENRGVTEDTQLSAADLRDLVGRFKQLVLDESGTPFPDDPAEQLHGAVRAVFDSWDNARARAYRRVHGIAEDLGTAVSVVAMVFGNMGEDSGTGVAFTRDPSTGERVLFGEFLVNAQGEDVVAGIRDPLPIREMEARFPEAYTELVAAATTLEKHYREMQDLEFTVEKGRLFMLQTRTGKRSAASAVRIAVEMVDEGVLDEDEAVCRVDPAHLDQLLHPMIDPEAEVDLLATGLPASPGAASGLVVFNPDEAAERGLAGDPIILVRRETSPEDFEGMVASRAIVTARGGMTSHAAVVARGMGKCCVVGASELRIDEAYGRIRVGDRTVQQGDWLTVDGSTGRIIVGRVPTVEPEPGEHFERLMEWADARRRMGVRANADTPADAENGRRFGAEGIGLCRTEHMFFEPERLDAIREMILAENGQGRSEALEKLLPMQRTDFEGIFRAMDGLPVTIRLLDPPLHEFLPHGAAEIKSLARKMGIDAGRVRALVEQHREANPMLGHRGVRLATSYPEITRMQATAIYEAARNVVDAGGHAIPEVMVPLVATAEELRRQRAIIQAVAEEVLADRPDIPIVIGTMIELPRAALTADRIARHADFFSFGTNDLTQTAFGLSRDDAGSFLPMYLEKGILDSDPFQRLDEDGVGQLVRIGTRLGREVRPGLKVGICGEHGGDPHSVEFFHDAGLDYVSCSPFRVPVARLAAARAALMERTEVVEIPVARAASASD